MTPAGDHVAVCAEDVVESDAVLREVMKAAGAARAALTAMEREGAKLPLALVVFARMLDAHRRRAGRPALPPVSCSHRDDAVMTPAQIAVADMQWPEAPGPTLVRVPAQRGVAWIDAPAARSRAGRRPAGTARGAALALEAELADRTLNPEHTRLLREKVEAHGVTMLTAPIHLEQFAVLHPVSAMPITAAQGFLQLSELTLEIVRDIVDRDGVTERGPE